LCYINLRFTCLLTLFATSVWYKKACTRAEETGATFYTSQHASPLLLLTMWQLGDTHYILASITWR